MCEAVIHHHEYGKAVHELFLLDAHMQNAECGRRSMPAELVLNLTTKLFSLTLNYKAKSIIVRVFNTSIS